SKVNPAKFGSVRALLQAADVNWRQPVHALRGNLDVRAEWVWSEVGRATYDPSGALGFGPLTFGNTRDGGYLQVAYRPIELENQFLRNLEFVVRWDLLNTPL